MPRLLRNKPEPPPKPVNMLPAGADHADWCQPVERLVLGLTVYEPTAFVHRMDPAVVRAPHLFRRVDTGEQVGPPPQTSGQTLTGY